MGILKTILQAMSWSLSEDTDQTIDFKYRIGSDPTHVFTSLNQLKDHLKEILVANNYDYSIRDDIFEECKQYPVDYTDQKRLIALNLYRSLKEEEDLTKKALSCSLQNESDISFKK